MRAVVQRVSRASCAVDGEVTGEIGAGFLVFLGIAEGDDEAALERVIGKISRLRIFEDDEERMNLPLSSVNGAILLISQFTLMADVRHGNRPSFSAAMKGENAQALYEKAIAMLRATGIKVETGVFGAHMVIDSVNDGPVTLIVDSDDLTR